MPRASTPRKAESKPRPNQRPARRRSGDKPVSVVTGGAGFLGSHLSDLLLSRGHRVIVIDNLITGSTDNIQHLAGNPDFRFIKQDVTEYLYLDGPVDFLWHFASPASPIDYLELPIQTLKVGALAAFCNLSAAHFTVVFKQETGCSPRDYLNLLRIHRACEWLQGTSLPMKEIAARLGYQDPFHFSRRFKEFQGVSPTEYRRLQMARHA